jgi:hypothetical protein
MTYDHSFRQFLSIFSKKMKQCMKEESLMGNLETGCCVKDIFNAYLS